MEQYDVYSSRNGLAGATISISRGHGKYKREKGDFSNEHVKMIALKVPRQSSPQSSSQSEQQTDSNAMSVLPRLLRTISNGNPRDSPGVSIMAMTDHTLPEGGPGVDTNSTPTAACVETDNHSNHTPGQVILDTDSSSSASSFISTPSSVSNPSFISFIAPGQLGSVAAMAAAAALNSPNAASPTSTTVVENTESSGLVTLATASTMFEKEWLARTAFANDNTTSTTSSSRNGTGTSTVVTQPTVEMSESANDFVTLTVDNASDSNAGGSPPMLFRTLTTASPQSQLNGTTPVTRAVLNVQELAALIRETQKQRCATSASEESPRSSVIVASSDPVLQPCPETAPVNSPSQLLPSSGTTLLTLAPNTSTNTTSAPMPNESSENPVLAMENSDANSNQPTAFISLQPAPGSILTSSDLQQLMASGEFMNSARTLLGQSPDGSTRQLYLLVPSDYPVIMSRASSNQGASNIAPASPLLDSGSSTAPILEAISPGLEPEESCSSIPNLVSSVRSPQPVTMSLPQLAGAVLAPMSSASTALSTLIAGLDARNQAQQARYTTSQTITASASSTSSSSWSTPNPTVQAGESSRIRLPINLPGLSLSDHNVISSVQSPYSNTTNNRISTLLGAVKSDPDMYTPNGHPYPAMVEDVNRYRSYPVYSQSAASHELPGAAGRSALNTSSTANGTFFQPDQSASLLLPQNTFLTATAVAGGIGSVAVPNSSSAANGDGNSNGIGAANNGLNPTNSDPNAATHFIPSPSLPRVNSFNPNGLSVATSVPSSKVLEDCRRTVPGGLLSTGTNGRTSAAYLEHLNPESKDIRRRVSHNEVERRRRDRINTWISELYKLLPPDEQAKSQYQSKGIVLKRVCEYFQNVDSMLKAANAAVEQARVENGLLRQRNRELQQENQLLSASLHLGAAAAAAHLKNRQPRPALHSTAEEISGGGPSENTETQLKQPTDTVDYPSTVTVFAVNHNADYNHGSGFSQSTSTCLLPTQTLPSASFATVATLNNCNPGVFALHTGSSSNPVGSSNTALVSNPAVRPLTLPSLDLVANRSDSRPE